MALERLTIHLLRPSFKPLQISTRSATVVGAPINIFFPPAGPTFDVATQNSRHRRPLVLVYTTTTLSTSVRRVLQRPAQPRRAITLAIANNSRPADPVVEAVVRVAVNPCAPRRQNQPHGECRRRGMANRLRWNGLPQMRKAGNPRFRVYGFTCPRRC